MFNQIRSKWLKFDSTLTCNKVELLLIVLNNLPSTPTDTADDTVCKQDNVETHVYSNTLVAS